MKTAILACHTIKGEVLLALERAQCDHDLYWVESNLHNFPDKLRVEIQNQLDKLDGYQRVLLAFAFCGNSVADLKTHSFELIVPRTDDCISLLIGSIAERTRLAAGRHSIYLTKGWLDNEANVWDEYQYTLNKYGEEKTQFVMEAMYGHHDLLSLVDTGAYEVASIRERAEEIATILNLDCTVIPGTTSYLEQLLIGPYDDELFVKAEPYSMMSSSDLVLSSFSPKE
jgi:hypothetical protein